MQLNEAFRIIQKKLRNHARFIWFLIKFYKEKANSSAGLIKTISKIQLGPYQDPSVPNVFLSWTYPYEILQMRHQEKWWSKYLRYATFVVHFHSMFFF